VKRPGYKIALSCGPIQQVTAAELSHYAGLFTSRFGQNAGVAGLTNAQLNALGITPRWYPPTAIALPTGANPNNVLVQAVQHGTQRGQSPPPPLQPPSPSLLNLGVRPK
jgi:hypothetical protein